MSRTKLNDPNTFELYAGKNMDKMPELVADGRYPLTTAGFMEERLNVKNSTVNHLKQDWWNSYFATGDGMFRHPDGRLKIVLGSKTVREINPSTRFAYGSFSLGNDKEESIEAYDSLEGTLVAEFSLQEVQKYAGNCFNRRQAIKNPLIITLAGEDKALARQYVAAVYHEVRQQFSKSKKHVQQWFLDRLIGVYVAPNNHLAIGKLWNIGDIDHDRSCFNAMDPSIDDLGGKLVGVLPEYFSRKENDKANAVYVEHFIIT